LLVQLSASQARKRLKGFGFGIRRIESVTNGQALIRHTATGIHLKQLLMLLADVLTPDS
jgi:hypothetical protein